MDTRIYAFPGGKPVEGSVAFDYKGWIISVSTVNGVYAEVLCWRVGPDGKRFGSDYPVDRPGIAGIGDAIAFIDQGGEIDYVPARRYS